MGTSLAVRPFAELVSVVPRNVPRLLLNKEPAGTCESLPYGFRFHLHGEEQNWRDAFHGGDCDEGSRALCQALGWEHDLDELIAAKDRTVLARAYWLSPRMNCRRCRRFRAVRRRSRLSRLRRQGSMVRVCKRVRRLGFSNVSSHATIRPI